MSTATATLTMEYSSGGVYRLEVDPMYYLIGELLEEIYQDKGYDVEVEFYDQDGHRVEYYHPEEVVGREYIRVLLLEKTE
jgi:hypothetical protein